MLFNWNPVVLACLPGINCSGNFEGLVLEKSRFKFATYAHLGLGRGIHMGVLHAEHHRLLEELGCSAGAEAAGEDMVQSLQPGSGC